MPNDTKVVLTGGHAATTGVATVQELRKRESSWKLFWVGPKKAIEGKQIPTSASLLFPDYGVYYQPIIAGRLQKKWSRYTIPSLLKVPLGFIHAFLILIKIRPNLIVSFGGYAALPIVITGWILRIPVILHSQTVAIGLANKLSIFFCNKIAVARVAKNLPVNKVVLVGNPVVAEILKVGPKNNISEIPVIYITGGSTGSHAINEVVEKSLSDLLAKYHIIHQTGELEINHFRQIKETLPQNLSQRYEVFGYHPEIWKIFERADIIVSRAGANTISEILVTQRPAILIPHPYVNLDEQIKNARLVESSGQFLVIYQNDLTPENLSKSVSKVIDNWKEMAKQADRNFAKMDRKAASEFVDLLEKCIN